MYGRINVCGSLEPGLSPKTVEYPSCRCRCKGFIYVISGENPLGFASALFAHHGQIGLEPLTNIVCKINKPVLVSLCIDNCYNSFFEIQPGKRQQAGF